MTTSFKNYGIPLLFTTILLVIGMSEMCAQTYVMSDAKINKVLVDTTLLLAVETTLAPGQTTNVHTHPAHFLYALTDAKLKVTYTDGEVQDWDIKAGESGFGAPERPHSTQNVGMQPVKFILVELKEHPYKAKKMK